MILANINVKVIIRCHLLLLFIFNLLKHICFAIIIKHIHFKTYVKIIIQYHIIHFFIFNLQKNIWVLLLLSIIFISKHNYEVQIFIFTFYIYVKFNKINFPNHIFIFQIYKCCSLFLFELIFMFSNKYYHPIYISKT